MNGMNNLRFDIYLHFSFLQYKGYFIKEIEI